ncbi:MAG: metal ABC transporter permease [Chloroflexi bacterium]|nr:metal ABC transporter permease [Chloroflexota bacterium]
MPNWFDLETYLEPLRLGLVQRGLLAALIVAIVCGVMGAFVVVRGLAFLGDALGHAVFPGVVIAYLLNLNPLIGGVIAGIVTTVGISLVARQRQIRESTAIGIFYTVAFALGALLLSRSRSASRALSELLIGNVLAVRPQDLWLTMIIGGSVLLVVALLYKELVLISFDPALAAAHGRNVALLDALLFALLALTIVVALQTVGNVMVVALLVVPAATGRLLTRSLPPLMAWAALIGSLSTIVGVYVSYYANIASGGAIVLCACTIFFGVLVAKEARQRWIARSFAQ